MQMEKVIFCSSNLSDEYHGIKSPNNCTYLNPSFEKKKMLKMLKKGLTKKMIAVGMDYKVPIGENLFLSCLLYQQ